MGIILITILTLGISLIETISYTGYIANHFKVPAFVFYLLGVLAVTYLSPPKNKPKYIFTKLLLVNSLIVSTFYVIFNLVESFTFQNFIFSKTHINLRSLNHLTFLSILFLLLFKQPQKKLTKLAYSGLIASFLFFTLINVSSIIPEITLSIKPIIAAPTASYDEKMTKAFPDFYPAIKMIEDLTPQDATIIIPPQKIPWVSEGNDVYINSFLFPRKITHLLKNQEIPTGKVYFIIAKGAWPADDPDLHGWPKTKISAKKVWNFDLKTNTYKSFDKDYNPQTDTWDWGLIEVDHE